MKRGGLLENPPVPAAIEKSGSLYPKALSSSGSFLKKKPPLKF
jgi:hypothetical protein